MSHQFNDVAGEASPHDGDLITRWANTLDGPVIDAGCGSGCWTKFLQQLGLEVMGMDAIPELVAIGRQKYPGVAINLGSMDSLLASDGYLAGVLAWYSIIRTPPEELPAIFSEFNRALRPGGSLLLGYLDDTQVESFEYEGIRAWSWPVMEMTRVLNQAGFHVTETEHLRELGPRFRVALIAVKQQ